MKRLLGPALVVTLGAAAVNSLTSSDPALASGPQTGELGAGGTVKGDISNTEGEQDLIGIDLIEGSQLYVRFSPQFEAAFEMRDPDGNLVTLPASKGRKVIAKDIAIGQSGRYEFRIASPGSEQGGYKLTAKPVWSKKVALDGESGDSFDLTMPAGALLKGKIKAVDSPGYVPSIDGFVGPEGDLLPGPVEGRNGQVSLPWTTVEADGMHTLTIGAASGSGTFHGTLRRKVPSSSTTRLDLKNGINVISYANDGVAEVFKNRCASCHDHDHSAFSTYPGTKGRAIDGYGRIKSGNMPPNGARVPADEVDLIGQWIKTGRHR